MSHHTQAYLDFVAAIPSGSDDKIEAARNQLTTGDVDDLLTLARDDSSESRWWAIYALSTVADAGAAERVVALLRACLQDEAATVRAAASVAVADLFARLPNSIAPLLAPLSERLRDDDGFVRQAAADSLARCGEREPGRAVGVLRGVLAGDHEGARGRAAQALHKIATNLRNPRTSASHNAFDGHFDMAVAQLAPVLFGALNDRNYLVHTHAHEALESLGLLDNVLLTR